MKNYDDLLHLAEDLVAYGRKQGADEIQVAIDEGTEFSVDVLEGKIEKLVQAGSKELSLKVILDKRTATASSSDLSLETLHGLIDNAVERARLTSQDPFAGLPEKEDIAVDVHRLGIFDPAVLELSPEKKITLAKETEAICLADKRIGKSQGAGFETLHKRTILANSKGFSGTYRQTGCSLGVHLQCGEDDHLLEEGWFDFSRNFETLQTPEEVARTAIHRTTRLMGARKVKTQNVPVVFEPPMTAGLLGFLYGCLDGNAVYMKQTFLADRLGDAIAGNNVTIMDDGLMPGVPGAKPFDSEGVPVRSTAVIQDGLLKNYMLDTYAGRKCGLPSTGNASGPNNFYLQAGKHAPDEIIASVDRGLLLTSTIGQGLVPTTGDMSRGAFGLWIENGKIAYPVAEITIAGNLGKMLKQIEMIGDDLTFRKAIAGPTIKIAEMTVGGL